MADTEWTNGEGLAVSISMWTTLQNAIHEHSPIELGGLVFQEQLQRGGQAYVREWRWSYLQRRHRGKPDMWLPQVREPLDLPPPDPETTFRVVAQMVKAKHER